MGAEFHARSPVVEMTWVIGDHLAAPGSQELTVHKGQQVEVLDVKTPSPDWCLVRMPTSGSVDSPPEGLVPLSVLKQPPGVRTSPSRKNSNDPETGGYEAMGWCIDPAGDPTGECVSQNARAAPMQFPSSSARSASADCAISTSL
ncbi:hypothetical protein RUM43_003144 [Polyplax serrata]|uniref:SH3 domain-containing protein n=1 Tax=Polyplax serrata TaxID=468196 RepID=A0AAN8PEY1_POLSC